MGSKLGQRPLQRSAETEERNWKWNLFRGWITSSASSLERTIFILLHSINGGGNEISLNLPTYPNPYLITHQSKVVHLPCLSWFSSHFHRLWCRIGRKRPGLIYQDTRPLFTFPNTSSVGYTDPCRFLFLTWNDAFFRASSLKGADIRMKSISYLFVHEQDPFPPATCVLHS